MATRRHHSRDPDFYRETCGFDPTHSVLFRLDASMPEEDYVAGQRGMLDATIELLRADPGDAALLLDWEKAVLRRVGGALVLNTDWREWENRDLLREISVEYNMYPLPAIA